jgi:hypothetical protein
MTSVALALPVVGLFLMQAAEHNKEPRQRPLTFALSQAAQEAPSRTVPGDKAFDKLFKHAQKEATRQALTTQKPDRKIVCGTVVIQVDDSLDPKFVLRAPENTSGLKIRTIQPPSCAD